jgi:septum formation protein
MAKPVITCAPVASPKRIILASKSQQRKMLLKSLGATFTAIASDVEETSEGEPREVVLANALAKGQAVAARRRQGTLVIAGDTEVVVDGRVVGQPAFEGEARWCLETLSGRSHEVLGALALIGPDSVDGEFTVRTGVETSRVTFAKLGPELIDRYLASEEWRGRAGGYAVQGLGSALVDGVEGDVSNVIGLPVRLLLELAPELDTP